MINVSAAFKAALENDNRNFSGSCTITLASGKSIPIDDSQLWDNGFVINDSTSSTGGFDIGSAIVQKFTLRLNNMYDDFTEYDFTGAEISNIKVSLSLSGKTEAVSKGVFTVNDTSYDGDIITLECLDNMHKFDVNYSKSNLIYPATLLQIVQDACRCCGVTLATDSLQFEYYNYVIQKKPDDNTMTFRDVLTWVGQISGHFWKCNKSGQLSAGWYNMSDLSAGRNIHTLQTNVVTDVNVDMDDVVITCVRIVTEDENSNQVTFQSGSDGYAVVIDSNKFINKDNAAEIASMVGGRVVGLRFRPMTVSLLQDPTIEAGDGAIVYDRKLKSYKTFFTNVVFSIDADNQMSNDAESALRNSAERFSEASKIYQDLKKHLNKNKTEWEKAMEELEKAMKEQVGLYPVIKTLDDGSKVYYMCDHQTLEESQVVFELNGKGWAVSTDGGNTWNAGLLVDGTMITKILNSIGINADWINTGAFTVLDSDGNIMFKADTATGRVDIVANSFQLRGKTLEEIAKESTKNYVDAVVGDKIKDINTQYFDSYDPTLTNKPASDWTDTDAKEKHIDDIFYNTTTKKMFRFVKIEGVYSWESFDDPDIKAALDAASTAQDTANGKRRVFLVTPKPPYDEGDMWVTSTTDGKGEIKICKTPRQSGAFSSADWISPSYVDSDDVDNAINEYDTSLGQPEIFNKLTNNGKNKGIYIQDGELYINASYILSGVLAGKFINGKGMSVTDKENKTTFYIDNDGNVMIAAKTLTIGGKDVEDIAGDTIDEKIKKAIPLVIQLSSEYQAIPVNADGNYSSFPRCEVKVQVFYGESDVTSEAAISYSTENITGTWSSGTHTYSVKSLSEDIGWVDFSTTYNGITITKRFNIAKQYAGGNGTNGKDATVYYLECETTTIKRCSNSSGGYDYSPSPLVFHLYSQTGAEERKQNISGRWTFEYTEDGSTWNAISGTGVGIDMKFSAWDRITNRTTAIRCTVGNSSGVILGMLSVSVLADAEVTREAVFNALTDNGDRQLIAYGSDGKLYINGEYIKSKTITADLIDVDTLDAIVAKIGGFVVGSTSIHTSGRNSMTSTTQGVYIGTNGFSVYKDASNYFNMNTSVGLQIKGGTIKLGNVTLAEASDKKSLSVKYGMQVHTQRSSGEFTDGSGEFKLINLTTVSSGYQTLCIASNIVYKLSSSSKRYKNHVRNMDSSEADKLLKVPVVWFQYKKGYLREGDPFEDKPVPGFYAEDVYKQYPEGVIFNEDGQIEDWNYRTMIPAMMKVIQNQNERINTLEDTVSTLNERLSKLEEMLKGVVK